MQVTMMVRVDDDDHDDVDDQENYDGNDDDDNLYPIVIVELQQ